MAYGQKDSQPPKLRSALFHSVRNKLLILMIALSLLPLGGMSLFSYFISKGIIQDRIRLMLAKMAQDTADMFDLTLRGKKEEIHSMATTFPLIYPSLNDKNRRSLAPLLNNYCFNHEMYDLLVVLDNKGNFRAMNTKDRYGTDLPAQKINRILTGGIAEFPEEREMFASSVAGNSAHHDWYQSKLVRTLYNYEHEDIAQQYNIAFSEPIRDPANREIIGVCLSILNWTYFQSILDNVEMDLINQDFQTGYGFMLARDADTTIAHKFRANRRRESGEAWSNQQNLYNTRLVETHGLRSLHDAAMKHAASVDYEFPKGQQKISGLAAIEDKSFGWIIGIGIDRKDILKPVRSMMWWVLGAAVILAFLVILFTYLIAEGITVPLKTLIRSARTIAQGNFDQRVPNRSTDEIGELASTFNEMAQALSAHETQLQELNKNLEQIVRQRTVELENSHDALKRAYVDLQNTQEQLIQTEKMASLGQLVAGIAHEIKNPLNFIYGNTGFLADYTQKLQNLLETCEKLPSISPEDHAELQRLKDSIHYSFITKDLKTLIDNFTEGAQRINAIVSDLRAFSRMDADNISEVDLHASLEMSLNLLRNQYKNRIEIHKEYGDIPKIQGRPGKLNQVFMNLLSNAFHAIQGKGDVWIRTRSNKDSVEVEIEDNGCGISKEHMNRIFEPFFSTKPVGQGTGLGLSISYGIIEQHQGKIQVTSTPQQGSRFTVFLPVHQGRSR